MSSPYKTVDERAVYHPISPKITFAVRALGVTTGLVLIAGAIMCFTRGLIDSAAFLLVANLLITALTTTIIGYFYKTEALDVDKYWYVIVVCLIALYKAIVSSVIAFNQNIIYPVTTTTTTTPFTSPFSTTTPSGGLITWATLITPTPSPQPQLSDQ